MAWPRAASSLADQLTPPTPILTPTATSFQASADVNPIADLTPICIRIRGLRTVTGVIRNPPRWDFGSVIEGSNPSAPASHFEYKLALIGTSQRHRNLGVKPKLAAIGTVRKSCLHALG